MTDSIGSCEWGLRWILLITGYAIFWSNSEPHRSDRSDKNLTLAVARTSKALKIPTDVVDDETRQ